MNTITAELKHIFTLLQTEWKAENACCGQKKAGFTLSINM
jgi:hypothetical protein